MIQSNFKKEKWLWEWERQIGLLIVFLVAKTYAQDKKWPWLQIPTLFIGKGKTVNLYFSYLAMKKSERLVKEIQKGSRFIIDYKREMTGERKNIEKYCQELSRRDFKKLSNEQLVKYLEIYYKLYRQHGVAPIRILNKLGPSIIENFLLKRYEKEQVARWLPILFSTSRESIARQAELNLLRLAQKWRGAEKKQKLVLLSAYLKRYQWLPCGYADEPPLSSGAVKEKLRLILKDKESPAEKLHKIIKERRESKRQRVGILRQLKLPPAIYNLVKAVSEFIFYKDYIRMNYNRLHLATSPLFTEIGRRLQLGLDEVGYFSTLELMKFIPKGKVDKKLLSERKKGYICFARGKEIDILTGEKLKKKKKELRIALSCGEDEIKGVCVSTGHAKGVVKVVKQVSDAQDFPNGAVLVTPMTTPELVPAAQKACAIITDEGGVTCHAAIVARELKKPCIVGTKIATKVFKDGDLVEVDAERGIVRKIH